MNILVVDDSIVFRSAISSALERSKLATKVQVASNGEVAINFLKGAHFDVVTLDMEMPIKDGLQTIKELRAFNEDVIVIVFSSQNVTQAKKTLEALELGADDFVEKMEGGPDLESNIGMIQEELIPRIKALRGTEHQKKSHKELFDTESKTKDYDVFSFLPDALAIGSSTGGPDALKNVFSNISKEVHIPIFLVQHMPPIFTKQLANMLNNLTHYQVKEAENGEKVKSDVCYVAPGDFHMEVKRDHSDDFIVLNKREKVCYVRPAVDVLFDSAAIVYKKKLLSIVLTGMGNDGTNGAKSIKNEGGRVLIQDEASSVVWGMPGSINESKLFDWELPLGQIPELVNSCFNR